MAPVRASTAAGWAPGPTASRTPLAAASNAAAASTTGQRPARSDSAPPSRLPAGRLPTSTNNACAGPIPAPSWAAIHNGR